MKVTKKELARKLQRQETRIDRLVEKLARKGFYDQEPQLKQLDQSVFDGIDEKWRFAAVDENGTACKFTNMPNPQEKYEQFMYDDTVSGNEHEIIARGYDATNWQNSLIEREKELTGSDLCRKMLERGDKIVLCAVSDDGFFETCAYDAICSVDEYGMFGSHCSFWWYVQPVNNKGEPLIASEVGL